MAVPDGSARVRSVSATGRYRKETLLARFGDDVLMPDVRHLIAQCPRKECAWRGVYCADLREGSD
jgi:hypothetical protein